MAVYEDRVGGAGGDEEGRDYFDGGEFAYRTGIEDHHYWHVHRRRIILEELRAFAPSPGPLLEVGCGIGTVATHLNANGFEVDYSDIFGRALEIASERAGARLGAAVKRRRFVRLDITRPLPALEYAGVLAFDVIEHLPDDVGVMRHLHDALPRDGFVMVTVPAFQFLWSPWDDVERHKRRYTRDQLTALLEQTGFAVERATYFFSPLFFAALGVKGLRRARDLVAPPAGAGVAELVEGQSSAPVNRLMSLVLAFERPWLERARLPFGTSILAIARKC